MNPLFDSRNPFHRCPVGAVEENTSIHFKIALPRALRCSAAYLVVREDGGDQEVSSMFWCGMEGYDGEYWECDYAPGQSGLYWYHFELDTASGRQKITRSGSSTGHLTTGEPWQLTVYQKEFTTPAWLAGGVMYQIFPDRFAASKAKKGDIPAGRTLRDDWGGLPQWRPNEKGEITNSDYFCGDLQGITDKLDYLRSLGVTCLYLNPIFEAHSNHRYNTADYQKIDPLLGTEEDFARLCQEAARRGMRVLLDGVFSHTGSDSVYFNREGRYLEPGAYQSQSSPYYKWYRFTHWPDQYNSWWGFITLPELEKTEPSYVDFINGSGGVARGWIGKGAGGWRLDVADELPDSFLEALRRAVKEESPDALLLGEVWEDASNKESYGHRRRYLLGRQLDSVMNYPYRDAVLDYARTGDARLAMERVLAIAENYPPQVLRLLMNHLGTHDTERALTVLAGEPANGRGRDWQAERTLNPEQRARGLALLRLCSAVQYTLPGLPCVYYGDEAGMEGYRDPFNRGCYPWGKEDKELIAWYQALGAVRAARPVLKEGAVRFTFCKNGILAYMREDVPASQGGLGGAERPQTERWREDYPSLLCVCNAGVREQRLPLKDALGGCEPGAWQVLCAAGGAKRLVIPDPNTPGGRRQELVLSPAGCMLLGEVAPVSPPAQRLPGV